MGPVRTVTLLAPIVIFSVWASLPGITKANDSADRDPGRVLTLEEDGIALVAASPTIDAVEAPTPALTSAERAMVEWARDRFALVGLDLPDVDVSFYEDTAPCEGHDGLFKSDGEGPRVRVCVPDRGTFAFTLERQRTLIHELAHAWEQASLHDGDRAEMLEVVDADEWYGPELDWDQRGAERFAETIVWGLYDQLRRPTLIDVSCEDLHADFWAITGFAAQGPLHPTCALPAAPPVSGP